MICRPVLGVFLPAALRGMQLLTVDKASVVRWWSMEGAGEVQCGVDVVGHRPCLREESALQPVAVASEQLERKAARSALCSGIFGNIYSVSCIRRASCCALVGARNIAHALSRRSQAASPGGGGGLAVRGADCVRGGVPGRAAAARRGSVRRRRGIQGAAIVR